jgi:hypothetical protein
MAQRTECGNRSVGASQDPQIVWRNATGLSGKSVRPSTLSPLSCAHQLFSRSLSVCSPIDVFFPAVGGRDSRWVRIKDAFRLRISALILMILSVSNRPSRSRFLERLLF